MAGTELRRGSLSEAAIDSLAAALFALFIGILILGYFEPAVPYPALATLPLLGSLATLFWANLRADRIARSRPSATPP
ncbi:MAG: hypothetical protein WBW47_01615 [Thermoplasmata archaeon]